MKEKEKPEGIVDSFFDAVMLTRNGHAAEELNGDLRQLIAAVEATGNKGTLTLVLRVQPGKPQAGEHTVQMRADIRVTEPKTEHGETVFFAKQDGTISRQPFAQAAIPFSRAKEA